MTVGAPASRSSVELVVGEVVLELVVVLVGPITRHRSSGHRERIHDLGDVVHAEHEAPRSRASTFVAIVPGSRSASGRPPVSLPRKLLRQVPITTGRPIAAISSSRRSSSRLCSTVLPNPIPGSSHTRSSGTPSATAKASRSSRKALTSETTSS